MIHEARGTLKAGALLGGVLGADAKFIEMGSRSIDLGLKIGFSKENGATWINPGVNGTISRKYMIWWAECETTKATARYAVPYGRSDLWPYVDRTLPSSRRTFSIRVWRLVRRRDSRGNSGRRLAGGPISRARWMAPNSTCIRPRPGPAAFDRAEIGGRGQALKRSIVKRAPRMGQMRSDSSFGGWRLAAAVGPPKNPRPVPGCPKRLIARSFGPVSIQL